MPLHHWHPALCQALPFELGDGLSVRDLSSALSGIDLSLLGRWVAEEKREEIRMWSICLQHRFCAPPTVGEPEKKSENLLRYVLGHLRFLVPTMTDGGDMVQARTEGDRLTLFRLQTSSEPIVLEDCELLCTQIGPTHLQELSSWMPWIVHFTERWTEFFPLFLSLYFSEKAYRETVGQVRHLLRVIALESLVSTDELFGKKALDLRLAKLIGPSTDLYAQYRSNLQDNLPGVRFQDVVKDVCVLRNKIAHGDATPPNWLVRDRRQGSDRRLCYADELGEAATSMVSLAWKEIMKKNLQAVIADRTRMADYFA